MAVAPEPYLTACLTLLENSIIYCRAACYSNKWTVEHVADLMDAIHNIPWLIQNWECCNIKFLRESFLQVYDKKWSGNGGLALCKIFDDIVAEKEPDQLKKYS